MVLTRLPATIDELISRLRDAELTVNDGPEFTSDFGDTVFIGWDGDPNGQFKAADTDQEWSGSVGTAKRDEDMTIICAAIANRGDRDIKAGRDAAYDLIGAVETVLRADPSLGFTSPYVAGVRPRNLFYHPYSTGLQVRVVFNITVKTRT